MDNVLKMQDAVGGHGGEGTRDGVSGAAMEDEANVGTTITSSTTNTAAVVVRERIPVPRKGHTKSRRGCKLGE